MKTIVNDIIGGSCTAMEGGTLFVTSTGLVPESDGLSIPYILLGSAMFTSGLNTAYNGVVDFKYEWNYEWSEVGKHNALSDYISDGITSVTQNYKVGKVIGNGITLGVDVASAGKSTYGITKEASNDINNIIKITNSNNIDDVKDITNTLVNTGRNTIIGEYYNWQTLKGDKNALHDAIFGGDSSDDIMQGTNTDYNKVVSNFPNIRTMYNYGGLRLR